MRLVHRVPHLDPRGGRFGLGQVRAEADIHPDDWFLTCHFVDDRVMPGTLMYECCLHTLRRATGQAAYCAGTLSAPCKEAWDVLLARTTGLRSASHGGDVQLEPLPARVVGAAEGGKEHTHPD